MFCLFAEEIDTVQSPPTGTKALGRNDGFSQQVVTAVVGKTRAARTHCHHTCRKAGLALRVVVERALDDGLVAVERLLAHLRQLACTSIVAVVFDKAAGCALLIIRWMTQTAAWLFKVCIIVCSRTCHCKLSVGAGEKPLAASTVHPRCTRFAERGQIIKTLTLVLSLNPNPTLT